MNEAAARNVVLARAFETNAAAAWGDEDRAWASRAAAGIVGEGAPPDAFLARRAALVVERLAERDAGVQRALRAVTWRGWVGVLLALVAFALGAAVDAIGPEKRVNVLAFPLFVLIAWNLAVYVLLLAGVATRLGRAGARGPIRRVLAWLAHGRPAAGGVSGSGAAIAAFLRDWTSASAPLTTARVGRVLHLAAFAFALGAIAGLYLRGLVFEYRAGWESTFLEADAVHRILSVVLGPAAALTGITLPGPDRIAAIRFSTGAAENAAPWIHLYATTIAIVVLGPRLALALVNVAIERRRTHRFPLAIEGPYFQKLLRGFRGEAAKVQAVPYSYAIAPQSVLGLRAILGGLFGPTVEVRVAPGVAFGGEDALGENVVPESPVSLVVALFALTATPEAENHGAFLRELGGRLAPGTPLVALVDESGFLRRFAEEPKRLGERRAAWQRMFAAAGATGVFVDLETPDVARAERDLARALDRAEEVART